MLEKPTEGMCKEARGFILGLDMNIWNWQDMEKHLDRGGYSCIPYIREMAAHGQGGHITKWDVADCIWQLMARAHPIPAPTEQKDDK